MHYNVLKNIKYYLSSNYSTKSIAETLYICTTSCSFRNYGWLSYIYMMHSLHYKIAKPYIAIAIAH